jgi:hypothetical protein
VISSGDIRQRMIPELIRVLPLVLHLGWQSTIGKHFPKFLIHLINFKVCGQKEVEKRALKAVEYFVWLTILL